MGRKTVCLAYGKMGLDIGPGSVKRFTSLLGNAETICWNGPMGVFEFPAFAAGTKGIAEVIVAATAKTFFLIDMWYFLFGQSVAPCARLPYCAHYA